MLHCFPALVLAAAGAAPAPMHLADVDRLAVPGPLELEARAELAAARQLVVQMAGRFADGWTAGASTGPRRTADSTALDVALELEAPWLDRRQGQGALTEALARAERWWPAAARAEARGERLRLYLAAWRAQRALELAAADLALTGRWRELVRERVEAGAEAPFELDLAGLAHAQAEFSLAAARAEHEKSWRELGRLSELPAAPRPLVLPEIEPSDPARSNAGPGLLELASAARAELEAAITRAQDDREQSRWAVVSSLEREGDDTVARFGARYRLPRRGETSSRETALATRLAAIEANQRQQRSALASRLATALDQLAAGGTGGFDEAAAQRALTALEQRLAEGKASPADAFRGLREIQQAALAALDRTVLLASARAEAQLLTEEVIP